jgi:hypothetical protein
MQAVAVAHWVRLTPKMIELNMQNMPQFPELK